MDVVVSSGAAWFANEVDTGGDTACGVVHCTDAAALDGCRCDETMGLRVGTGLALSPARDKLYGTGTHNGTSCLVVCMLSGTAVTDCEHYEYPDAHGVFVSDDHLYVYRKIVSTSTTSFEVLVCDLDNPASSNCLTTSPTEPSRFPGPFGMSVFDGSAYVANGDNILVCSDVGSVSDCHATNITGINTRKTGEAPTQQTGLKNIFIYAIPAPGESVQCSAWGLIFWLSGVSAADNPHSVQADPWAVGVACGTEQVALRHVNNVCRTKLPSVICITPLTGSGSVLLSADEQCLWPANITHGVIACDSEVYTSTGHHRVPHGGSCSVSCTPPYYPSTPAINCSAGVMPLARCIGEHNT